MTDRCVLPLNSVKTLKVQIKHTIIDITNQKGYKSASIKE